MDIAQPFATGRKALTISEFCQAHGISRGFFYKLKQQGLAPRITALGAKTLIMDEDGAEWRRAMAEKSVA
jgi:hypothetical protein